MMLGVIVRKYYRAGNINVEGQCLLSAVLYGQTLMEFLKLARLHEQEERASTELT